MLKRIDEHHTSRARACNGATAMFPLNVEDLRFEDRGRILVDGMSFTLDGCRRTVVMGANGAGKSLLLRLLHGLITPTSGRILWGGKPISDEIRAHQAMVFQRPTMLRRSAEDNLKFVLSNLPRKVQDARVETLLAEAKLAPVRTTPARLLSGGEQQRLAIARARALDPEVLFLDEPTASLDPASTHAIEEMIRSIDASGTKIVLITHDRGQAQRLADEIVFVEEGRISEVTPADTFFESPASNGARAYLEGRLLF